MIGDAHSSAPPYSTTRAFKDALELHARLRAFKPDEDLASSNSDDAIDEKKKDLQLAKDVHGALDVLGQAARLYGASAVVTSFNGGKDAVVILHLTRAALAHHAMNEANAIVAAAAATAPDPSDPSGTATASVAAVAKEEEQRTATLLAAALASTAVAPRALYFDEKDDFEEVTKHISVFL